MILIPALIICLSGCQSFPKFNNDRPIERCFTLINSAGEGVYAGKCRCHQYIIKNGHIGRVSDSYDKPLDYCNKFAAYSPGDWVEFVDWFDSIFNYVNKVKRGILK